MRDGPPLGRISILMGELNDRVRAHWREGGGSHSSPSPEETAGASDPRHAEPRMAALDVELNRVEERSPADPFPDEAGTTIDWERPYWDLSDGELEEIWSTDPGDAEVEEVLLEELQHRTSVDARILKYRIIEGDY